MIFLIITDLGEQGQKEGRNPATTKRQLFNRQEGIQSCLMADLQQSDR